MSLALSEVLKQLALKPGERRCVTVDDYEVEIRRPMLDVQDAGPMVDIFLTVPPSENARMITLVRGESQLPKPIEINESDLAPE